MSKMAKRSKRERDRKTRARKMNAITPEQALKGLEHIIERQREQIEHQKKQIAELKVVLAYLKDAFPEIRGKFPEETESKQPKG